MVAMGTQFQQLLSLKSPKLFSPTTTTTLLNRNRRTTTTKCKKTSNSDLASGLAMEVAKMKSKMAEKEQALKKSKKMLFSEFSEYLAMKEGELKIQWIDMCEDDKWGLVRMFVSGWDDVDRFKPLSVRCVKQMIDDYVVEQNTTSSSSSSLALGDGNHVEMFSGLRRVIRFSQKN